MVKKKTLVIEFVVVIVVIGIVVAILFQQMSGAVYKAYENVALQEARSEYVLFYSDNVKMIDTTDSAYVIKVTKEDKAYYFTVINAKFSDTLYTNENAAKEAAGINSLTKDLTKGIPDENKEVEIFGKAK